jgi:transcriptional regulator with XRE-family HTH domain
MTTQGFHPEVIAFGRELRDLRLQMGLTLAQLGDRSGLTASYIGSIENGTRDPSLSTVVAIANGLGISAGQLFGGKKLGAVGLRVARLFDKVPVPFQDGLLVIIRSFVEQRLRRSRRPRR